MKSSPGQQLRETIAESTIQIPGVTNALTALLAQELGFHAVQVSAAGFRAVRGVGKDETLEIEEVLREMRPIAGKLALPVVVDPGVIAPRDIASVVRACESAGAAAVVVHDASARQTIPLDEVGELFSAAAAARLDANTIIVARTVARLTGGLEEAIVCANLYLAAGVDWIQPEGLKSYREFERFAAAVDAPLAANMDEYQDSPLLTAEELAGLGYAAALYPMSLLRVAMKAIEGALDSLAESGSQHEFLEIMQTDQELARLLASGQRGRE
jgi:methylisocitrate lyase